MTSANKEPENTSKENMSDPPAESQDQGEVALDPHPTQALKDLVTGSEPTNASEESGSKNA